MNHRLLLCLMACLGLTQCVLLAQFRPALPVCAASPLNSAQRQQLANQMAHTLALQQTTRAQNAIMYIPIRPHIYRLSNGSGGIDLRKLNNVMAIANSYFLHNGSGIQFYFCGSSPNYVDDDYAYYNFGLDFTNRNVSNALNQYYVDVYGAGGAAFFPENNILSTVSHIQNGSEYYMANRSVPHELGHTFSLIHTFGNGPGTTPSSELVTRQAGANCATAGDELCDTPADPYYKAGVSLTYDINGCLQYDPASNATDANGQPYQPSVTNMMSYYFSCNHEFTPDQYNRIQAGLALRRTHTAYTLDCPPSSVATPTQLVASFSSQSVVLNWQDNADNEMGYFIERSSSDTSGFVPIGGVGPNTTRFVDDNVELSKTYYYRIRPSNTTTNSLSQPVVVSIKADLSLSGQVSSRTPLIGQAVTYSLTITNGGPANASGIGWENLLPDGLSFVSGDAGVRGDQTSVRNTNDFSLDANQQVTFTYQLQPTRAGVYVNTAQITKSDQVDSDSQPNSGTGDGQDDMVSLDVRTVLTSDELRLSPNPRQVPLPKVVSNQPLADAGRADLSLLIQTSKMVLNLNEIVSYTLTVNNGGGKPVTHTQLSCQLADGLSFVSGTNWSNSSGTLSGELDALGVGESRSLFFQAQVIGRGMLTTRAQISESSEPDSDSTPGNGFENGEDDSVSIAVRIID